METSCYRFLLVHICEWDSNPICGLYLVFCLGLLLLPWTNENNAIFCLCRGICCWKTHRFNKWGWELGNYLEFDSKWSCLFIHLVLTAQVLHTAGLLPKSVPACEKPFWDTWVQSKELLLFLVFFLLWSMELILSIFSCLFIFQLQVTMVKITERVVNTYFARIFFCKVSLM